MVRTRNTFVLAIVLVCGLALATATKPVDVNSVVSNASPADKKPVVGFLFATSSSGQHARSRSTTTTTAGCSTCKPRQAPPKFFDRD